ncbi:MAG: hypothetical protein ACTS27_00380 [Phycisphaerales bacterium]
MRTPSVILLATSAAAVSCAASAGSVAYSNFGDFAASPGNLAQASAVTAGNTPMVVPFLSNTASMRIVLDAAADVSSVRVLTPTLFVDRALHDMPQVNLGADPSGDIDPRDVPSTAGDPSSLAPLRVSIYASAADVQSRTTFASMDFGAGDYDFSLWSANDSFYEVAFDLGGAMNLTAGEWFIEVAQIDPVATQFFLAVGSGDGLHRFDPDTMNLMNSSLQFALELGDGVVIPLPASGALAIMGLSAVAARRRR